MRKIVIICDCCGKETDDYYFAVYKNPYTVLDFCKGCHEKMMEFVEENRTDGDN